MKFFNYILFLIVIVVFEGCENYESTKFENSPPEITLISSSSTTPFVNSTINIICYANDPDGDSLSYQWENSDGSIIGEESEINWLAPNEEGLYQIICVVTDGVGGDAIDFIEIEVIALKISILPTDQVINCGSEAIFSMEIKNATNLFAFSCEIIFNGTLISLPLDPLTIGGFWNNNNIIFTSINEFDRLNIAIGLNQGENGISGNGILCDFKIIGNQNGNSEITINNITLSDQNGDLIDGFYDIEINNANLIIQ